MIPCLSNSDSAPGVKLHVLIKVKIFSVIHYSLVLGDKITIERQVNPIQPCSERSRQETTLQTTLLPPQRLRGALRFGPCFGKPMTL